MKDRLDAAFKSGDADAIAEAQANYLNAQTDVNNALADANDAYQQAAEAAYNLATAAFSAAQNLTSALTGAGVNVPPGALQGAASGMGNAILEGLPESTRAWLASMGVVNADAFYKWIVGGGYAYVYKWPTALQEKITAFLTAYTTAHDPQTFAAAGPTGGGGGGGASGPSPSEIASGITSASERGLSMANIGYQGLQLRQQIAGSFDSPAAAQARRRFILENIIPAIQGEIAATQKALTVPGLTQAEKDDLMLRLAQENNDLLQAQLDADNAIKDGVNKMNDLLGKNLGTLAFSQNSQTFTDLPASLVGV